MEFQQLTSFVKVAEHLSFSKAAEALGYSQAAITIQIKQLETELGVLLFDRIGKRITLTNEGEILLEYALSILRSVTDAKIALSDTFLPQGKLRIGASESLCTYILPSVLATFHKQYPNVTLSLRSGNVKALTDLLQKNEVDLICLFSETDTANEQKLLFSKREPFVFIASPDHPLLKQKKLSLKNLSKEAFLLTEPGCSYRLKLEQLLIKEQLTIEPLIEIGNTEAIKRYAASGLGIALLPYFAVQKECAMKELAILPFNDPSLCLSHQLLCHKNKHLTPLIDAFVQLYKACLLAE